jgi:dextranase
MDATVLASGGFHLELGDGREMLCHEYFPNRNLRPNSELLARLKPYYDFSAAYQVLLSGPETHPYPVPKHADASPTSETAVPGKIWSFTRQSGNRKIVHLINLVSSQDSLWRDTDGKRHPATPQRNVEVAVPDGRAQRAWFASPDDGVGAPHALTISNGKVVVPRLDTWTMVVFETD